MKFEYSTLYSTLPTEKFIRRPMVEVRLLRGDRSTSALALLDSGADDCLFNIEYARYLGIDVTQARTKNYTGISGDRVIGHVIEVMLTVKHIDGSVDIPVSFIDSTSVDALLGQEGFFDNFRIKFERDHGVFEINQVKK